MRIFRPIRRRISKWRNRRRAINAFVRTWEAAQDHRLNQAHYQDVVEGETINERIAADLSKTRARCIAEAEDNPMIDGIIVTHQGDIVGDDGPELQVRSSSDAYNSWLEAAWKKWFRAPTPDPRISGAALLRLWVRGLWEAGEFLAQKITLPQAADGTVKLRLQPILPERLLSPTTGINNPWLFEGVEIHPTGEPIRYWILPSTGPNSFEFVTEPDPIPSEDIVHHFIVRQPDQLRGRPWLASCLSTAAKLRDYDDSVASAARQAAMQGVYWYTDHPDAPFLLTDSEIALEDGTQSTGPPGWKPGMLTPQQPTTQYREYREERQAELGRPAGMPLMIVRLDAGRHNYSSARFDGMNYDRTCHAIQISISGSPKSSGPLTELLDDLAEEQAKVDARNAYRSGDLSQLPPERPADVEAEWIWPRPPRVDPQKEAEADKAELDMGTLTYSAACGRRGTSAETIIATRQRDNEALEAANLPPVPTVMSRGTTFARHEEATGETPESELVDESESKSTDSSKIDQEETADA